MTAARIIGSSREGTAHPPVPRPPSMQQWLAERERVRGAPLWRRVLGMVS